MFIVGGAMMASKKEAKKDPSAVKSIVILYIYLCIWWIFLTLTETALTLNEGDFLCHFLRFLRISVPICTILFGVPIILIVDSNKALAKRNED